MVNNNYKTEYSYDNFFIFMIVSMQKLAENDIFIEFIPVHLLP